MSASRAHRASIVSRAWYSAAPRPRRRDWGFALYDPATETCTPAILRTGQPAGHPSEAFDTAAIIHLADYQQ